MAELYAKYLNYLQMRFLPATAVVNEFKEKLRRKITADICTTESQKALMLGEGKMIKKLGTESRNRSSFIQQKVF